MKMEANRVVYLNRGHPTQVSQPGRLTLHMSCISSCYFRGQGEIKPESIMNKYWIWVSTMGESPSLSCLLFSKLFRYSWWMRFSCPLSIGHRKSSPVVLGVAMPKWPIYFSGISQSKGWCIFHFPCWPSTTARATLAKSETAAIAMLQSDLPPLGLPLPLVPAPGVRLRVLPWPYLTGKQGQEWNGMARILDAGPEGKWDGFHHGCRAKSEIVWLAPN